MCAQLLRLYFMEKLAAHNIVGNAINITMRKTQV